MEDQSKFIDPEYLPNGLVISSNNHKFGKPIVDALLEHWTKRDAEGDIPFRFKNPDKADRCRRRLYRIFDIEPDSPTGEPEGGSQNASEVNGQVQSGITPRDGLAIDGDAGQEVDANQSGVSSLPKALCRMRFC